MYKTIMSWLALCSVLCVTHAYGQVYQKVVDIPTRPGVFQRVIVQLPPKPKAAMILFAGGHGGLQILADGSMRWGAGNFLIRSRQLFLDRGLLVAAVDAPSDRQTSPYLSGFRQKSEHVTDIKAVIAWLRDQFRIPVWLVGTSRGTQSAAYVATQLSGPEGPDGLVLTATMLTDDKGIPVPAMPLERLRIPVLVVHHEQDGCRHCSFEHIAALMKKLEGTPIQQLLSFKGGDNDGNPCEAFSYHGFKGIEPEVVAQIANWVIAK